MFPLVRYRTHKVCGVFGLDLSSFTDTKRRQGNIDERFKSTYDKLSDIRNQLERLTLTQAWSLRETDLYNFQRQLDRVDESRINGNFEDESGYKADLHAQRVSAVTVHVCDNLLTLMFRLCCIS